MRIRQLQLRDAGPPLPPRPRINPKALSLVRADLDAWNDDIVLNIERNFSVTNPRQFPMMEFCPFFSDAILRKDPAALERETRARREVIGIEMEVGGALYGLHRHPDIKVTTIRGVSDIVGLRREEVWTAYAAEVAATGLMSVLKSGHLRPRAKSSDFERAWSSSPTIRNAWTFAQLRQSPQPDSRLGEDLARLESSCSCKLDGPQAEALIRETLSMSGPASSVSVDVVLQYAKRLSMHWIDSFGVKLVVDHLRSSPDGKATLAELLGEYVQRNRPSGDFAKVRKQCEEAALQRHWGVSPKQPVPPEVETFVARNALIQDYFLANALAWRYSTYSTETKRSRAALIEARRFLDKVYGFRVNQMLKEIVTLRSRTDRQYEGKIVKTIKDLLALPADLAIPPANLTHVYYMAGRISSEKLRHEMRDLLEKEIVRVKALVDADVGPKAGSAYLMMWRSLYVSLGYLGKTQRLCDYIQLLLTNPEQDEHNRGFHLEYYGDQPIQESGPYASVDQLQDFSKTMQTLISRLSRQSPTTLLEAQTLASLAQKRHEQGAVGTSLSRADRQAVSNALRSVLRQQRPTYGADDLNHYLRMIVDDLQVEDFRAEAFLHKINRVRHEVRSGWKLRNAPRVESVGAHSFSAMALAMDFLPEEYTSADDKLYSKLSIVSMLFHHDRPEGITGDIPTPQKTPEHDEQEEAHMRTYGLLETYRLGRTDPSIGRIGFSRGRNDFIEFQQGRTFNSRVAKEIDRIDAIYEALTLLADHPDLSNRERYFELIARQLPKITTELGHFVLQRVERMDPQFKKLLDGARAHGSGMDARPSSRY